MDSRYAMEEIQGNCWEKDLLNYVKLGGTTCTDYCHALCHKP